VESAVAEAVRAHGRAWSPRRHGRAAPLREVSFFNGWGRVRVDEHIRISVGDSPWARMGGPPSRVSVRRTPYT
jgi:hypothetical protein